MIVAVGEINPYEMAGQCLNKDIKATLMMGIVKASAPAIPLRGFQGGRITVGVVGQRHITGTSANFDVCS